MFNENRPQKKDLNNYSYRLVLDVGTEFIKAVMVEYSPNETGILGYARVKQRYGHMEGGSIADIPGVLASARLAVGRAIQKTPHRPRDVVMGIAGSFIKGVATSLEVKRRFPHRAISNREMEGLMMQARRRGLVEAERQLKRETGREKVEVHCINSAVTEVKVDGYRVANPLEFRGHHMSVTVFHTFCPMIHIGAMLSLARGLGLPLAGAMAEPFAVAASILSDEAYEFGAIVIDMGGGTTDIALIRNGGIEGTEIFALGGRAFTRSLAARLQLTLEQAERLKLRYSRGELGSQDLPQVQPVIESNLQIFYEGLAASLKKLARNEALPRRVYICGGGSGLRGLMQGLKHSRLFERLPYFENPDVRLLRGEDIKGLGGEVHLLTGQENVTPAALVLAANNHGRGIGSALGRIELLG